MNRVNRLLPFSRLAEFPQRRLIDATWSLDGTTAHASVSERMLRTARWANLDTTDRLSDADPAPNVDPSHRLPHPVLSSRALGRWATSLGIRSLDDHVVVYDQTTNFMASARLAWQLLASGHRGPVHVLAGNINELPPDSFDWEPTVPASSDVPAEPLASLAYENVAPGGPWLATLDEVRDVVAGRAADTLIVDARSRTRFLGLEPESRPGLQSGHMPGSLNVPFADLVDGAGDLLPADELRSKFDPKILAHAEAGKRLILSCGTGVTACVVGLALNRLGLEHSQVAVYDGSWTEYARVELDEPVLQQ
uniref:Sulfurtransferase n=1 Tax=Sexangularia sp. CB-2014 TaxID=1486929 RepID=A0A7S1VAS4_9EUKA|mmetsp:Transcript_15247/g.47587  ORF Transcript_15247/g.47587 Transcript_15247/m.47587 type:complete len:308 (+) Transcript_15247:85-1008(+)